jgi:hypothetical protein
MLRLLLLLVLSGAVLTPSAARSKEPPSPDQLVQALGDPDFATRERAAAALRALGPAAIPAVKRALKSDDPEIRRHAAALLPALQTQAALAPRPVALKGGPIAVTDALKEITKQTGYLLSADPPAEGDRVHWDAGEVPFWEAVERITGRTNRSVAVATGSNDIRLLRAAARSPFVSLDGAFRVELPRIHEDRDITFTEFGERRDTGKRDHRLTLHLSVLAEPRFIILTAGPVRVTEATDDKGGKLTPAPRADDPPRSALDLDEVIRADCHGLAEVGLRRAPQQGTKVRALSGVIPIRVVVERKRVVVPNYLRAGKKEFRVGNANLSIRRVELDPKGGLELGLNVPADAGGVDKRRWHQRVIVEDLWGNRLTPNSYGAGTVGEQHHISVGFTPPRGWLNGFSPNLVVEDWVILETPVRFSFKDVPLP